MSKPMKTNMKPCFLERVFKSLGFVLVYDGSKPNGDKALFSGQDRYLSESFVRKYRLKRSKELSEILGGEVWADCWVVFKYREGRFVNFDIKGQDSNGYKERMVVVNAGLDREASGKGRGEVGREVARKE